MMKKRISLICIVLAMFALAGCTLFGAAGQSAILRGIVMEANLGYVLLCQVGDDGTVIEGSEYEIPLDAADRNYEPSTGDILEIRYGGQVTMSLPAKLGSIESIRKVGTTEMEIPQPRPRLVTDSVVLTCGGGSIRFDLPGGWSFAGQPDEPESDSMLLCQMGPKDPPAVSVRYEKNYGICGTGVVSEKLESEQGLVIWKHTETANDCVFLSIVLSPDSDDKGRGVFVFQAALSEQSYRDNIGMLEQMASRAVIEIE